MTRLPAIVCSATLAGALVLTGGCSNRESAQARAPRDTGTATAVTAADGVQEVTVSGSEQLRFTPSKIRARAGRLRIILVNTGATPHDLDVVDADHGRGQSTGLVQGGARGQVTVTLSPGVHAFECTLHIRVHMTGTIVVS